MLKSIRPQVSYLSRPDQTSNWVGFGPS